VFKYLGVLCALIALSLAACSGGTASSSGGNPLAGVVITVPTPSPVPTATPVPTPTPEAAVNVLADPGFETEGAAGAFNPANGWSPCSIPQPAIGSTATTPPTPIPAVTPPTAIGAILTSATAFIAPGSPTSFNGNDQISTPPGSSDSSPVPVAPAVHGGSYAALTYVGGQEGELFTDAPSTETGLKGSNGICQTFAVPTGAALTLWVNEGGTESGLDDGAQEAYLIPQPSGTLIPVFIELNDTNHDVYGAAPGAGATSAPNPATQGGTYVEHGPYMLTAAPYNLTVGESVELFIGTEDMDPEFEPVGGTRSGFGVFMFVDDVSVFGVPAPAAIHRRPASVVRPHIR